MSQSRSVLAACGRSSICRSGGTKRFALPVERTTPKQLPETQRCYARPWRRLLRWCANACRSSIGARRENRPGGVATKRDRARTTACEHCKPARTDRVTHVLASPVCRRCAAPPLDGNQVAVLGEAGHASVAFSIDTSTHSSLSLQRDAVEAFAVRCGTLRVRVRGERV